MAVSETIRRLLARRGRRAILSLAWTFIADDQEIRDLVDDSAVLDRVAETEGHLPFLFALGFKAGVLLLEYGIPPVARKWRRFSRMPLQSRLRVLDNWERGTSPMRRNLVRLMKFVILSGVLTDPAYLEWTGYGDAMRARLEGQCLPVPADGEDRI